ncbi:MAG: 50S ribosomal protein L4 [Candidatus Micrarchaeaceae archaeon]
MKANILDINGKLRSELEMQSAFEEPVREDIIRRAVLAESSLALQPQAHSVMAGIQTTASYFGAMSSYRTGRHVGHAIRPKEKLGGGVQGKVRRIPSAVKGRRAHPHMVEKILVERINLKEYRKALRSAVAATASNSYVKRKPEGVQLPIIISDEIEAVPKTKSIMNIMKNLKLSSFIESCKASKHIKRGRSGNERHYRKSVLLVVSRKDAPAIKAARNIAGADACDVHSIKAGLLAPGGMPGRLVVWSESAFKSIDTAIEGINRVG